MDNGCQKCLRSTWHCILNCIPQKCCNWILNINFHYIWEQIVECCVYIRDLCNWKNFLKHVVWWYSFGSNLILGIIVLLFGFISGLILHFHYQIWGFLITFLVVIGALVTLLCFLGCCCLVTEHRWMIISFIILGGLYFFCSLCLSVSELYTDSALYKNAMEWEFNTAMEKYEDAHYYYIITEVQSELSCCGTHGPVDWEKYFHNSTVPPSCCKDFPESLECTVKEAFSRGCFEKLMSHDGPFTVESRIRLFSAMELLSIVLVYCLYSPFYVNVEPTDNTSNSSD